jgi:hypothetical protein
MASLSTPASFTDATGVVIMLFIALTSFVTTSGGNTGLPLEGLKVSVEIRRVELKWYAALFGRVVQEILAEAWFRQKMGVGWKSFGYKLWLFCFLISLSSFPSYLL